jgi:hypothetical protein
MQYLVIIEHKNGVCRVPVPALGNLLVRRVAE